MKPRVFYEVDPHNRLIIKSPPGKSNVKKFRKVVTGRFKTDKKNKLCYEVFKASEYNVPQKIKFSGKYSLNKKHNLIYTLNKWGNQCQGNKLEFKTGIMHADGGEIAFLLGSKEPGNGKKVTCYIMKLNGVWSADKNNRLCFGIEGSKDKLILSNAWQINKNNEIVYRYGTEPGVVTLKGDWEIKNRYRLGYALNRRLDSGFDFRTSLGQVVPKRKKSYVKFDIAIEISKRKRITRKIIFTGKLKLDKARNIILEFSPRRKAALKFTKNIFNQKGLAYIESFLKGKERYLGAGLAFRW